MNAFGNAFAANNYVFNATLANLDSDVDGYTNGAELTASLASNPGDATSKPLGTAVNGTCGSANGIAVAAAPTANLCSTGLAGTVTGAGPWTWTCIGSNGGTAGTCSASRSGTTTPLAQTITFGTAPSVAVGGKGTVNATASSGLPVTLTAAPASICTISGAVVTGVASGICTIFADQAGNATYSAATRATLSFSVTGGPQITPIPSATIVPKVGLWNSASEPGSGYQIDLSGTTMIVTTFSYTVDGLPQWYLSVGALANNTFRGTLDKYRGGPCISCGFQAASIVGNDGELVIMFTSPTTATLILPGGRGVPIARFVFGRVPERDDND